jgi:hypothetical protein
MVLNAIQRADWGGLLRGVVAGVLALGGSLIACAEAGGPERKLIEIFLTPNVAAVEPGGKVQFVVTGSWSDGSDLIPVSTFEATGGSIQPLGEFTAGSATGTFSVVARATGTDITDTAEVTITATPPVLQSISLSPASSSVTPGGSIQFAVSGTMSDGSSTTPLVVYSATGGLITPLGRFTAGSSLGTFRVIATQFGGSLADTSTVTIDAPTAATPFLVEDWSTYTSTANFHSDPRSIYDNEEFGGPWGQWNRIELDQTTGIADIGAGTSTKSMKYTWPDRTNATGVQPDAPRCADFYILKVMRFTPAPEVWGEFYVKFSANWTSRAPASWGCQSNADYKFLFYGTLPGSRFSLKNDYAGVGNRWDPTAPGQGDGDNNFIHNVFHDNQWHRIRWRAKLALGGQPGIHEVWLDNTKVYSQVLTATANQTGIYGIFLGNNMNQGPGHIQTLHFGLVRLYSSNPGW